ncbi:hypothetical protein JXA12_02030 [Candidatus Woesearchaeota archaeon]|nr:hypothetical protein [Candidatus Woesearchaeota archaeon]
MHEPDKEPEAKLVGTDPFSAQIIANVSLVCGALTIIGLLLAFASGRGIFLGLAVIGIALAVIAERRGKENRDERARTTAVIAIILNVALFLALLFVFLFFKEASMAV